MAKLSPQTTLLKLKEVFYDLKKIKKDIKKVNAVWHPLFDVEEKLHDILKLGDDDYENELSIKERLPKMPEYDNDDCLAKVNAQKDWVSMKLEELTRQVQKFIKKFELISEDKNRTKTEKEDSGQIVHVHNPTGAVHISKEMTINNITNNIEKLKKEIECNVDLEEGKKQEIISNLDEGQSFLKKALNIAADVGGRTIGQAGRTFFGLD
ncbi:hypothetical protein [Nitrosopumilus sp. b2]|uniref:hypothetical protein n=1 Tax=Nitrosopumilus sp. b2 TaxID=2109908 RepID=UPI0015F4A1CA|nr:hypothetical protein [Nitrosopumilus sp. b2]KAF6244913.1 hypothetical protein C6989_05910 [Nitrosopumilus sp. b2]